MKLAPLSQQAGESCAALSRDEQRPVQLMRGEPQRLRATLVLRLAEVCALTGYSARSITRREAACQFPQRLPQYGRPRYRTSDVLRWMDGGWSQARAFGRGHRIPR